MWLYDHFYGPGLPDVPSFEAWTLATALLTRTTRLRVGHLVLCNNFRHPALLAKLAATLDVISNGRLDLGIGSGSVEEDTDRSACRGVRHGNAANVSERRWRSSHGCSVQTYLGTHHSVSDLPNLPVPM